MTHSKNLSVFLAATSVLLAASGARSQEKAQSAANPLDFPLSIDKALCEPTRIPPLPAPGPSGTPPTGDNRTSTERNAIYRRLVSDRDQVILFQRALKPRLEKLSQTLDMQFKSLHMRFDASNQAMDVYFPQNPEVVGYHLTQASDQETWLKDQLSSLSKRDYQAGAHERWDRFTGSLKRSGPFQGDATTMYSSDHIVRNRMIAALNIVYHRYCAQFGDQSSSCKDKDEAARYEKLLNAFDSRFRQDHREMLCSLHEESELRDALQKAQSRLSDLNSTLSGFANYGVEPASQDSAPTADGGT